MTLERHENGRWVNPVDLKPLFPRQFVGSSDVLVCSFRAEEPQRGLFFGPHAIVRMRPGLPDDRCPESSHEPSKREPWASCQAWCLLEDMSLEFWETETVLLENRVELRFVQAFRNGERRIADVRRELEANGYPEHEITGMLRWAIQTKRVEDWAGYRRYQLQRLSPDETVPVTWRETLAECAGPCIWEGLAPLVQLENKQAYRILTSCF